MNRQGEYSPTGKTYTFKTIEEIYTQLTTDQISVLMFELMQTLIAHKVLEQAVRNQAGVTIDTNDAEIRPMFQYAWTDDGNPSTELVLYRKDGTEFMRVHRGPKQVTTQNKSSIITPN